MAANCYGRRLSELLQEQQEPFLIRRVRERERRGVSCTNAGRANATRSMLCGAKAVRKALLWDLATGCFSCGCGARDRFRRLPHPGDIGNGDEDGGRQLSPVSVLDLRSDEESTELTHPGTGDNKEDGDDSKPSTSASSPSSDHLHLFSLHSRIDDPKVRAVEVEDGSNFCQTTNMEEDESFSLAKTEQAIVSAWERITADISRLPKLVELDLSQSAREWRRRIKEEEAWRVGESIEAMIFEEVRWEAVRDMLCVLCSDDLSAAGM